VYHRSDNVALLTAGDSQRVDHTLVETRLSKCSNCYTQSEVSSSSSFVDMLNRMPKISGVM